MHKREKLICVGVNKKAQNKDKIKTLSTAKAEKLLII